MSISTISAINERRNQQALSLLTDCITTFLAPEDSKISKEIAEKIVKTIDWDNSVLMHKGISWMAKDYLYKNGYIEW